MENNIQRSNSDATFLTKDQMQSIVYVYKTLNNDKHNPLVSKLTKELEELTPKYERAIEIVKKDNIENAFSYVIQIDEYGTWTVLPEEDAIKEENLRTINLNDAIELSHATIKKYEELSDKILELNQSYNDFKRVALKCTAYLEAEYNYKFEQDVLF
jgi:hypothetical protein